MKRILSLLLALSLLLSVLLTATACGGRDKRDLSEATSLSDLAGAVISAQTNTFHDKARGQIADVKGASYPDFDSLFAALKSGVIDGYIAEEPTAFINCMKDDTLGYVRLVNNETGFTVGVYDTAISVGCRKGSPLIAQINAVLANLTTAQRNALMDECFEANKSKDATVIDAYTVSLPAPSAPTGKLRVALECAYDPFNWTQFTDANGAVPISGATGLYANGYDVQIARYLAASLNLELEICATGWDSLIVGVQAGIYDAIIAGMSPTEERREQIDFSEPYYNSNLVVIYQK